MTDASRGLHGVACHSSEIEALIELPESLRTANWIFASGLSHVVGPVPHG